MIVSLMISKHKTLLKTQNETQFIQFPSFRYPKKAVLSAVIEYHASFPKHIIPHGNAMQNEHPYIKTDPVVLNKIRNEVKHRTP